MRKYLLTLLALINIFYFSSGGLNAQSGESQYNTQYNATSVVKRLSYENFKNIKLLRTAIFNYGGGEAEVQQLVDQYADATALYFQDKVDEAAGKFTQNEREIFKVAKKIAGEYNKDASVFMTKGIKRNVQLGIEAEADGKARNEVMNKYLENAKFSLKKGTMIYDDYKYTTEKSTASSGRLIASIYYYRMAKQNLFLMYQAHVESLKLDPDKKKDKEQKDQMFDKLIKEDYKADYKKDMQDNKNKVYVSMEKKI